MSNFPKNKSRSIRTTVLEENKDGDLVLTFTEEELKILGVKPGDALNFKVINGELHIKKSITKKNKKLIN